MLKLPAMKIGQFAALLMLLDQPTHAWLVLSEQQFLRWPVQFSAPNLAFLEQLLLWRPTDPVDYQNHSS